jgi:crotonobetainyl-CoA:carnitine CoA-transferase CaiB-like acyl-CoA transferase
MSQDVRPLSGVRVLDFTAAMLGPSATQVLGDYGADVIKVERPVGGDQMRTTVPDPAGLDNPLFLSLNRNKRSIALDLKSPEAMTIVHELVKQSDVIVSNYRAGVMDRLSLGYEAVKAINPRIIWA